MKIVINADDFGKSPARNQAVIECFKQGWISSAGIIVTGRYCDAAAEMIDDSIGWGNIHLHLNFSANLPAEGSDDVPLTEAMRRDSFFSENGKFKKYRGLPQNPRYFFKWKEVYDEIEAQYEKFMKLSGGKGDVKHLDCHLWYNLTWPVAYALNKFTRQHGIEYVRYWALHHNQKLLNRLIHAISTNAQTRYIPATNIDYFLSKKELHTQYDTIELYCHPNYKNDVLMDDSPSYIGHKRLPMAQQIESLNKAVSYDIISWADLLSK